MLKYVNCGIVFQEIPDEVTLSIIISNCPCHCPGCHSNYLWTDTGTPLDEKAIDGFVKEYGSDITCICLMGGDSEPSRINSLARYIKKNHHDLHVGWYSGRTRISRQIEHRHFDYIKIGPYLKHLGGLKEKTTNQRLYKIDNDFELKDITNAFWKKPV